MYTNVVKLKNNLYFLSIAKNACSTLKYLAYNINNDVIYNEHYDNLHNIVRPWGCNYCWNLESFIKPENSIVFTIYRDPVERFLSAYINMKKGGMKYTNYIIQQFNGNKTFDDFLDYAKYEFINIDKDHYYDFDEHFRPQSFYYNYDDIDYLVKIEDLDSFLQKYLGDDYNKYYKKKQNVCNVYKNEFLNEINENHINQIKELYKEDYLILEKYKDKLYVK